MANNQYTNVIYRDAGVQVLLNGALRRLGDLTPAMRNIGEDLLLAIDEGFENETDPDGIPWAPNSAYTIAQKKARGQINKILQRTGRMRAATTYRADRNSVTISNNTKYARKHQLKTVGTKQRRFIGIGAKSRNAIVVTLKEYVANGRVR